MLLTLSTTHAPATDLGYLLAKNPAKVHSFELAYGRAHVFYPDATPERCTAALLLDTDPIGLVRGRARGDAPLEPYVNDRPYVASSFLSVAIAQVLGSALAGKSRERQALADAAIPLEITIEVVPCRGGEALLKRLFEPIGYEIAATRWPLDEAFPAWGESRYYRVELATNARLRDVLAHLYVLLPVLDEEKHYWVGDEEVAKLLARGEGWLEAHPERETIALRYLKRRRDLARAALDRLVADEGAPLDDDDDDEERAAPREAELERATSLDQKRIDAVITALLEAGATSVIDVGCGEGKLVQRLLREPSVRRVTGVDVSPRALETAARRLRLDELPERERARVTLFQGALTYRDKRFAGYDAMTLVEVIEHVEPARLAVLERVVFEHARPATVVVTTPNVAFNEMYQSLRPGALRHPDHRFEWTQAELEAWANGVASRRGYGVRFAPIGDVDPRLGPATQMAIFSLLRGNA